MYAASLFDRSRIFCDADRAWLLHHVSCVQWLAPEDILKAAREYRRSPFGVGNLRYSYYWAAETLLGGKPRTDWWAIDGVMGDTTTPRRNRRPY